jgi:hypothetical protein
MGIPLILIMILLIWSPIILFAFLNTIGNISAPESAVMTVSLEGFPVSLSLSIHFTIKNTFSIPSATLSNGGKGIGH